MDIDIPLLMDVTSGPVYNASQQFDKIMFRIDGLDRRVSGMEASLAELRDMVRSLLISRSNVNQITDVLSESCSTDPPETDIPRTPVPRAHELLPPALELSIIPPAQHGSPPPSASHSYARQSPGEDVRPSACDEGDQASTEAATDRLSEELPGLRERIERGILRPEDLVFLTDEPISKDDPAQQQPKLIRDLLQAPNWANRHGRREAFCIFFTPERFKTAWTAYVSRLAKACTGREAEVRDKGMSWLTWVHDHRRAHWPHVMSAHYDIQDEQSRLGNIPGNWEISDHIVDRVRTGGIRLPLKMPKPRARKQPNSAS